MEEGSIVMGKEKKDAAAWNHYNKSRPRGPAGPTGKNKNKRRRGGLKKKVNENEEDHHKKAECSGPPTQTNTEMEDFYKHQAIVPEGEAWSMFLAALKTPLPVCVRINRSRPGWGLVIQKLKSMGVFVEVPWYPDGLALKCEAGEFNTNPEVKQWVDRANAGGLLTYQEEVSMLPAHLLGVEPHHLVLDTCATPGSKTLQCIDRMHFMDYPPYQEPLASAAADQPLRYNQGLVLANDCDTKFIPVVRTRKLASPTTVVAVGNAAKFPPLFHPAGTHCADVEGSPQVLYDRIVCDVPCSGDGTLRKNPSIWSTWSLTYPLKLHTTQLRILMRALHHLAPGGRLTYSTCSMNPIENEAVVLAALARLPDVHLVPPRQVPFPTEPALTSWKVAYPQKRSEEQRSAGVRSAGLEWFEKWEDVPLALRPPKGLLRDTMFAAPVTRGSAVDTRIRPGMNEELRQCLRVLPHNGDTGGFFVAVFTKSEHKAATAHHLPPHDQCASQNAKEVDGVVAMQDASVASDGKPPKGLKETKPRGLPHYAREYLDVDANSAEWQEMCDFHGIATQNTQEAAQGGMKPDASLPTDLCMWEQSAMMRRVGLSLVSKGTMKILKAEPPLSAGGVFIHSAGIRIMEPIQANFLMCCKCRWRPAQEGAAFLSRCMSKQRTTLALGPFKTLLENRELPMDQIPVAADSDGSSMQVGGVVVGVELPSNSSWSMAQRAQVQELVDGMWLACVLTGKGLQGFTSNNEIEGVSMYMTMLTELMEV